MSEQANDWRDGLDAEQQATVLKATAASFNEMARSFSTVGAWEKLSPEQRDKNCNFVLAGLRAAGVLPPAPVRTHGEVVAERLVVSDICGILTFCWDSSGLFEKRKAESAPCQQERLREVRQSIAAAIDAERAAARNDGLEEAAKWLDGAGATSDAGRIRALKTGGGK